MDVDPNSRDVDWGDATIQNVKPLSLAMCLAVHERRIIWYPLRL